jgi:hypothetical protein
MIREVFFRNYKGLREVRLEIERLTVLIGPNGSGKTSVLEGLSRLVRAGLDGPRAVLTGPRAMEVGLVASRGALDALELSLEGMWRGKRGALGFRIDGLEDFPFSSRCRVVHQLGEERSVTTLELPFEASDPVGDVMRSAASPLVDLLPTPFFPRFSVDCLAAPAQQGCSLDESGAGLAGVLVRLSKERPDAFLKLQDALRAVIPGLLRVRHAAARIPGDREEWGYEVVLDLAGASDVPARVASEGTLLVIGAFTAMIATERPMLLCLDHLERALHPAAARRFLEQIELLLAEDTALQIVATTDSPILLDHVKGADVRVLGLGRDGAAACVPLALHPDYPLLKDDLRPGELWRQIGDAWVAPTEKRQRQSMAPPEKAT